MLREMTVAPSFELLDQNKKVHNLENYKGQICEVLSKSIAYMSFTSNSSIIFISKFMFWSLTFNALVSLSSIIIFTTFIL